MKKEHYGAMEVGSNCSTYNLSNRTAYTREKFVVRVRYTD